MSAHLRERFTASTDGPQAAKPTGRFVGLPASVWPAGALLLFGLLLLPVVHAPFFGDDVTNSEMGGYLELTGQSLVDVMLESTQRSLTESGRPQLLIALVGQPISLALEGSTVLYHLYLLALTVLDAGLLYVLLRRLGLGRAGALLPVVLAGGLMQLRIYHDSLLAYAGLIQVLFALTLVSAIFFERWLRDGRRLDLCLAVGVFLICPLIYEVTYTFVAVHIGLAFSRRRGRAAVRAALPFVAIAVCFVFVSWLLRRLAPPGAVSYSVGGGPWDAIRIFFVQLFPPLPVTSLLFDPSIGGGPTPAELLGAAWRAVAVALAIAGLSVAMVRERISPKAAGAMLAVGLALWVAPPALLSLTPKYQTELGPGKGYLPVLMQVFGVSILLVCGLRLMLNTAAVRSRAALVVAIAFAAGSGGVAAGATAFNNFRVLAILQPEREVREVLEAATADGVFSTVPEGGSILFSDRDLAWSTSVPLYDVPWVQLMLANQTGREYDARVENAGPPSPPCPRTRAIAQPPCAVLAGHTAWARARLRSDGGTVIVAPTSRAASRRDGLVSGELLVYRSADGDEEPAPPDLIGTLSDGQTWTSEDVRWRRVKTGEGWALYTGRTAATTLLGHTLDDARAIADFLAMPAPGERVRLVGTKHLLP